MIALAILGQSARIDGIGFGPLALGLGGRSHLGRIDNRDGDLSFVKDFDHGLFIATGSFTNDVDCGYLLESFDQLAQVRGGIEELALAALQMKLQGSFGDIDSGIDSGILGLHSFDRVRTQPYVYELTVLAAALATVRVWSTGRARLWLGFGLTKVVRGLHELAHAAKRLLRKGIGLISLPTQGNKFLR